MYSNSQPKRPRHIPWRSCVACREGKPKHELIRLVCAADGRVEVDFSGKKAGRGAYLCYSSECWEKGLKKNRLEHALRGKIGPESWAGLLEVGRTLCSDDKGNS
ncbi:MAG: hypothetical protein A2Y91_06900 [Chloroflexi bacterium RBG_13_54_8]|nr:MAG: hypothetical protein A2Y91_06900 [Chloroflexi bacterium RBG_13_54_8]